MTLEQLIAKVAELEARIAVLEARPYVVPLGGGGPGLEE